ncbi:EamA family transporter [Prauserella endophytica]|uniref:DMT family transporter n=1 Tax=Prauserella endophytica TaxID=1592324 RepID=A0ABY2S878_9PSEU|nr:EamA family transporter [Prauserella endophytica]PXY29972.1 multidrug DMT transporter permease [Prauserella coralliicola]TKG71295.1 DMT family transporter [Prauserella endophytica]
MGPVLALASAAAYGLSDFAGGLLARRAHFVTVALLGQAGGLVVALLAAPAFPSTPRPESVAWGALSGVGTGIGMLFLFRGLSRGAMSVVVPVSAVGGVALPVLVGVLFLEERPSVPSWLGIAVAVPALWLVSRTRDGTGRGAAAATADGLVASVGIALQYLALAQADPASGIWPVVTGRVAAILTILPLLRATHVRARPSAATVGWAAVTGALAALALVCYLLATRQQLVVIAVVLSSLYPVIPVLLGITVLRERLGWRQTLGLVAAGAAIALLTLG